MTKPAFHTFHIQVLPNEEHSWTKQCVILGNGGPSWTSQPDMWGETSRKTKESILLTRFGDQRFGDSGPVSLFNETPAENVNFLRPELFHQHFWL